MSLSAPLLCMRCGFQNLPGYQFCTNCGSPLGAPPAAPGVAPQPVYAVGPAYPSPGYYPSPMDYDRTRQIDRTKTGVLLLMIGALLGWVPYGISLIGGLLSLIGAILVILGRRAFGARHSRDVVAAVVLYILSFVALIVVSVVFAIATVSSMFGTVPTAADLEGAVNTLLIGSLAVAIIAGIAQILFTYEIQDSTGRYLLFGGLGASVALQIAIYFIIAPLMAAAISEALAGGTFNSTPLLNLENQASTYALLAVVANLLWAAAYYMVWSRISRGEIPKPLVGPGAPPMPPPYAGAPPQAPPPGGPAPPMNPQ